MNRVKKPNLTLKDAVRNYARLNKNFIVNGDLAKVAKRYHLTGRDLSVLIALSAEAQRRNKRTITFPSFYAILDLLEWSDRASDYQALDRALAKWMGVEISIERFYVPANAVGQEFVHLLDNRGPKRSRGLYESTTFKRILYVDGVGDGIRIQFDKEFWGANSKSDGYFIKTWPEVVRQLRYPPEIFLWLLLSAFNHSLHHNLDGLRVKTALSRRSRPWLCFGVEY